MPGAPIEVFILKLLHFSQRREARTSVITKPPLDLYYAWAAEEQVTAWT